MPRFWGVLLVAGVAFCCALATPAVAQNDASVGATQPTSAPATQPAEPSDHSLLGRQTLTDGWLGASRDLAKHGLRVGLDLTQVWQHNTRGGLSTHSESSDYSGRYDLAMDADLQKLAGVEGGRLYALIRGAWQEDFRGFMNTSGSLSSPNFVPLGDELVNVWELYYEQSFYDRALLVRAGRLSLSDGYDRRRYPGYFDTNLFANDETTQFLNEFLVQNPTIPFPASALGASVYFQPVDWWYLSAAIVDGEAHFNTTGFQTAFHGPDTFFRVVETGVMPRFKSSKGDLPGNYRVGWWYRPPEFDRFYDTSYAGFYTSCDQMIWKENDKADDSQGLGIFARYGHADQDLMFIKDFWSTGLQYQGLIPTRDNDVTGLGVASAIVERWGYPTETVLEWYYNIEITPWMHVTPDVQYIFDPSAPWWCYPDDALVLGIRVKITF